MMVFTDSIKLYDKACERARQLSSQSTQDQCAKTIVVLEAYYVRIIGMMFYELITKKNSLLLSRLCDAGNLRVEVVNFSLTYQSFNSQVPHVENACDLYALIHGLNIAFSKNLDECSRLFATSKYAEFIFQARRFSQEFDYITPITEALRELDANIFRLCNAAFQGGEKTAQKEILAEPKSVMVSDRIIRAHDSKLTDKLNQLAENRKASDGAISEQVQQLQVILQNELKQIMAIREDIDYNIMREAICQFISLFSLLSETLQYHPNDDNKDSYYDLIESCKDFLENIKQSLAMLGVTIINDVGKPFDTEKHKAVRGMQPSRLAAVTKVVKIGFIYKNKVLEKAEVELAQAGPCLFEEE